MWVPSIGFSLGFIVLTLAVTTVASLMRDKRDRAAEARDAAA